MKENEFFNQQTVLTSAKTKIYKDYIEGYLPKLLITFNTCHIIDLFCGPGKNGEENGSPLILVDRLSYILSAHQLKTRENLKVYITFNDQNEAYIENLKSELSKISYDKDIIEISIKNEGYNTILTEIIEKPFKTNVPTFFFLDPFTYSNVKMEHLKSLISLPFSEVLLFVPIFHSYRFSNANFTKTHKTRIFIEEFTTEGMTDYANVDNFLSSVRGKLLKDISLKYVRPILIDGGASKNAIILLTKHQKGMLLINKIAFNLTKDGNRINVKNQEQYSLFQSNEGSQYYEKFYKKLISSLKIKSMTNDEIVDFTIVEGFLPKLAKEELTKLYKLHKICVFDSDSKEVTDTRKWNIADEINKKVTFKWKKNE